jgi:hypothetical protein
MILGAPPDAEPWRGGSSAFLVSTETDMCDFYSWIEKDKKLYFLDDATIEARWPNDDIRDHIGHAAIEEIFPEARGGQHKESAIDVPLKIAKEINRGHMDKMAKAGQWAGARYDSRGHLISKWWRDAEQFIAAIKQVKFMDNHGIIKPEWKVFDTRDQARDQAGAQAGAQALAQARAQALAQARAQALAQALAQARAQALDQAGTDFALYASCLIADPGLPHSKHATDRLDVWLQGYGLLCDVNGVLYVYKRVA